ncbi:hypothetical protein ACRQQF_27280, partial [Citrobacter arsenatis]|uniref:hypothetical protein n=1 Tax=Citrobacter arsenatis TaxID=2546350 RepID=UPI003D7F1AA7
MTTISDSTVATVLATSLRPVRAQLELAVEQTAGISRASVESALALTDQLEVLVIEQYNQQVDEFNAVVEQCEALDDRNTTLGLQAAGFAEKLADMELTTKETRAAEEI